MRRGAVLAIFLAYAMRGAAFADDPPPIIGDWCGLDDYVIHVRPGDVSFHPMRGLISPPAYDIRISENRAVYKQKYGFNGETVVNCRLDVSDPMTAVESCDADPDHFYPNLDEQAQLKRCFARPVPGV